MSKAAMNLQDSFLNQVRRENSEVRVLLVNGTLLRGTVKGFDNFTLILNNRNGQHLIYKHAVAQIVTHRSHVRPEDMQPNDSTASEDSDSDHAGAEDQGAEKQHSDKPVHEKPAHAERQQHERHKPGSGGGDRPPRQDRGQGDNANRNKSKKEGFNTLDLSGVKLGDSKEG